MPADLAEIGTPSTTPAERIAARFARLQQKGAIVPSDPRRVHSSDDTREATIQRAQKSLERDDDILVKAAKKLLHAVLG